MKTEELRGPILETITSDQIKTDFKVTKQVKTGVYRAVTDYVAVNTAELNLTRGDVIKIDMVYNEDLCHGLNETTQLSGLCHSHHLMQDMTIDEDPRLGFYRVISSHIAERPNEMNMVIDDLVRVETIFTDGYCYA